MIPKFISTAIILFTIVITGNSSSNFIDNNKCSESLAATCSAKGDTLCKELKFDSAVILYKKAGYCYENIKDWYNAAKNYRKSSKTYNVVSKYDSALVYSKKAFEITESYFNQDNEDIFEKSDIFLCMADIYESMGRYKEELSFCNLALKLVSNKINPDSLSLAKIWNKTGIAYNNLGNYDTALFLCNTARDLRLRSLGTEHIDVAESYYYLGTIHGNKGEYIKSIEYFQKALKIRLCIFNEQHPDIAQTYNKIGMVYFHKKKYDNALEYFQKALKINSSIFGEQHIEVASCYNNIGIVNLNKGNYDKAMELYLKSLRIRISLLSERSIDVATSYNNIGVVYLSKGDYNKAEEYIVKCLEIRVATLGKQHPDVASSYYNLGVIYHRKEEHEQALKWFQQSLKIRVKMLGENHPDVANCYNNIGAIFLFKGEYNKAIEYHEKALRRRITALGEQHLNVAQSYHNLGLVYNFKGEYDKALEFYLKTLKIYVSVLGEKHPDVASAYSAIAAVYIDKGEYNNALEFCKKALNIYIEKLGEQHSFVASNYLSLGLIYNNKKQYDTALVYFQKALDISKNQLSEENSKASTAYLRIGEVYFKKGEYNKAYEYSNKALKMNIDIFSLQSPDVAENYNYLGKIESLRVDYLKALQNFQKALIANIPGFVDTSTMANPTLKTIFSKPILLESLTGKANAFYQIYRKTNLLLNLTASLDTYDLALQLISNLRKEYNIENAKLFLSEETKSYFTGAIHVSMEYAKLKSSPENNEKPFEFIEKGKGSALYARFNDYSAKHLAGIPDSLIRIDKEFSDNINYFFTKIIEEKYQKKGYDTSKVNLYENLHFSYSRKWDSLIAYFENMYPDYYKFKYDNKTVTIEELQRSLDKNTAVIDYFVGDTTLFIATITDSIYNIQELKVDSTFNKSVKKYYQLIKNVEPQSFLSTNQKLYNILFKPVKKYIKSKDHLVIIPDDYLYYIPFETLIDDSIDPDKKVEYRNFNYLIKSYSISYNHSATIWHHSKEKSISLTNSNFLGFAPVFNKEANGQIFTANVSVLDTAENNLAYRSVSEDMKNFNPLPYSKDEVVSIVKLFEKKKKEATAYLESEATETNFKNILPNFSIVHISSHSFSNDKEPALSGIVFSQPKDTLSEDDGILYTGEAYNLNLNADLIVLSSCESGIGKLIKGEGLQALSRGFMYCGAKNIMFSLWKVQDKTTHDLMVNFYSNVLEGKNFSEALRLAKLKLIEDEKTSFPNAWADFVLIGK